MELIADTNIFLAVVLNEPEKARIIRCTVEAELSAPEILPYEIGNALTAMCKRRQLSAEQAMAVQRVAAGIPVRLHPVGIGKALKLALKFNIYAYDAYFLECARLRACPLLTLDQRMQRVAMDMNIELLEL